MPRWKPRTIAQRFWEKVAIAEIEECWPYKNRPDTDGYGITDVTGKSRRAHRLAYELTFGPIPAGLQVRHKCDNPPCCNPSHLQLGTNKENAEDMVSRGRSLTGERNPKAKLTKRQVETIRQRYRSGNFTQKQLAEEYQVTQVMISMIVLGKSWKGISNELRSA